MSTLIKPAVPSAGTRYFVGLLSVFIDPYGLRALRPGHHSNCHMVFGDARRAAGCLRVALSRCRYGEAVAELTYAGYQFAQHGGVNHANGFGHLLLPADLFVCVVYQATHAVRQAPAGYYPQVFWGFASQGGDTVHQLAAADRQVSAADVLAAPEAFLLTADLQRL